MGAAVLYRTESSHRKGSELPREDVMGQTRREVRKLADKGLSPVEIQERADFASMNETERDLVWLIATHEVDRARRT